MARYNPWKGRKISDLADFSPTVLQGIAPRDLRSLVTRMASAANKRVRSLRSKGAKGPALKDVESAGMFTARGKSDNELIGEYLRLQRFIKDPTSTVKGNAAFESRMEEQFKNSFEEEYGNAWEDEWGEEYTEMFWKLYGRWSEVGKQKGLGHYDIVMLVGKAMSKSRDFDSVEVMLESSIQAEYTKREYARKDYDRASPNIIP